jgi:hypothetical protein
MMTLRRIALSFWVLVVISVASYSQTTKRPISKTGLVRSCVSGMISFKCPKGYKVLLSGRSDDRLFFATNPRYRYAVFAVSEPMESTLSEALPKIIRAFSPKVSGNIEWKDVEVDPRKSSKYEVESRRRIGIDRPTSVYLTLEYRIIDFNGKKLLTGTIVDGYEGPNGITEAFENGTYTTNGGCFDSVDIIAALTKEVVDHEKGPCFFMISIGQ